MAGAVQRNDNSFRKVIGQRDLRMVKGALNEDETTEEKLASTVDDEHLAA